jgi:four helix bundle protein
MKTLRYASQLISVRNAMLAFVSGGEDLRDRTKRFALRIPRLYRALPSREESRVIGRQLLRSDTSVGANYWAACRARSKAEFVAKLGIVPEEADETVFWLELLQESTIIRSQKLGPLIQEARELTAIFVASICTAKGIAS